MDAPFPAAAVDAAYLIARRRSLAADGCKAFGAVVRAFAIDLDLPEIPDPRELAEPRRVGAPAADDPRAIGEAYWRARSENLLDQRRAGRYYTPVAVIDRILDLADRMPRHDGARIGATVCDPAAGCGFFLLRLVHNMEKTRPAGSDALIDWAEGSLHGVDRDHGAVLAARISLWLALSRPDRHFNPEHVKCGDSLLGPDFSPPEAALFDAPGGSGLDWRRAFPDIARRGGFDVVVGNPPYGVLTNFTRHPEQRVLARALRRSGYYPDAVGGRLNLYRFFIERSLALLRNGGALAMIVPASLARDKSAARLRQRLLERERADVWLFQGEQEELFRGVTQATCVFRAVKNGGGATRVEILTQEGKGETTGEAIRLEPDGAVPLPDDGAGELAGWLGRRFRKTLADVADIRVGEVDQTLYRDCMRDEPTGCLLARGAHLSPFLLDVRPLPGPERFLDLDLFLRRKGRQADACKQRAATVRVAQLGIRNMNTRPRLVAALVPPGVYLGNSLNAFIPRPDVDPSFLAALLDSALLDRLFRRISGNNNINLHEVRGLPVPDGPSPDLAAAVAAAYTACEAAAAANAGVQAARAALDRAVDECYDLPDEWRTIREI
ncbi:MAG: N-6 DNA methylase [Planctomycetota bacterium]|nr:N-6 DNA methylase [Planctomycetota bacterium]